METRPLGRSALKVSVLALGTMNFGSDWHGSGAVDEKLARDLVDLALDRGVNLIDTADIYGRGAAEELLGKILKGRRSRVLIASKVLGRMREGDPSSGGLSREHIAEGLNDSLRRLKTDYLDLYMCHGSDPRVPLEETLEAFHKAVAAGKVRVLGCSNLEGREVREWIALASSRGWTRPEFNQVQYSLAVRDAEGDMVPLHKEEGVSLLAWSPLGGGLLTGKYAGPGPRPEGRRQNPDAAFPPLPEKRLSGLIQVLKKVAVLEGVTAGQAALGWALGCPALASAIVGARSREQLAQSLSARPLSAKARVFLDQASRAVQRAPF